MNALFTSHLNEPMMVPVAWLEQSKAILAYENQFWESSANSKNKSNSNALVKRWQQAQKKA
ncbi:MAG: hypothetical protein IPO71_12100 [Nitrosomonas sp.]|nr:hypothetical protein [Nitrosomonas sp.]